jgi:hypothetical protein
VLELEILGPAAVSRGARRTSCTGISLLAALAVRIEDYSLRNSGMPIPYFFCGVFLQSVGLRVREAQPFEDNFQELCSDGKIPFCA